MNKRILRLAWGPIALIILILTLLTWSDPVDLPFRIPGLIVFTTLYTIVWAAYYHIAKTADPLRKGITGIAVYGPFIIMESGLAIITPVLGMSAAIGFYLMVAAAISFFYARSLVMR